MDEENGAGPGAGSETPFVEKLVFEEDHPQLVQTFLVKDRPGFVQDPDSDYWFWNAIFADPPPFPGFEQSLDFELDIPNPSVTGSAEIRVNLWGRTMDLPDGGAGHDHRIVARLNGTEIGAIEWSGLQPVTLVATELNAGIQGLLVDGTNTLTLESYSPRGTADQQLIDSIEVDYVRNPVAKDDQLWMHDVAAGTQKVSGFSTDDIVVIENPASDEAVIRNDIDISGGMVTFDSPGGVDFLLVERDNTQTAELEGDQKWNLKKKNTRVDYLIITSRDFAGTALALASHRSYHFPRVRLVYVNEIYDEWSAGRVDPHAVRRFMEFVANHWKRAPQFVAIIGKGTIDLKDRLGWGDSYVPTLMATTRDGLAVSDDRLMGGDGDAPFAIGRIPVVLADPSSEHGMETDGLNYVMKLYNYEATLPGEERYGAVLVADENDPLAGDFHVNMNNMDAILRTLGFDPDQGDPGDNPANDITLLYHPDNPVRAELTTDTTWHTGLKMYDGHGSLFRLGRFATLFDRGDAAALNNAPSSEWGNGTTSLPIFAALSCSVGAFGFPNLTDLATTMVLNKDGGPVAAMSPTGASYDEAAQSIGYYFVNSLYGDNVSLGEAVRDAKIAYNNDPMLDDPSLIPERRFMTRIYTVIGEPAVYAR